MSDLAKKVAELTGAREAGSSALDADSLTDRVAELGVEQPAAEADGDDEGASAFEQLAQKQIEDRVPPSLYLLAMVALLSMSADVLCL